MVVSYFKIKYSFPNIHRRLLIEGDQLGACMIIMCQSLGYRWEVRASRKYGSHDNNV